MIDSTSSPFQRLKTGDARKAFYAALRVPAWWLGAKTDL